MRRFLRENALSLFFLVAFLLALAGQSVAGTADYNARQPSRGPVLRGLRVRGLVSCS